MSGGYIGSKISLISRSDIRYVGILHHLNPTDSTVALEQGNLTYKQRVLAGGFFFSFLSPWL